MAVKITSKDKHEYIGLSGDGFPSTTTEGAISATRPYDDPLPEGSSLHYIDTGEMYIYHDGMWEPDKRSINAMASALGLSL